MYSILTTLGLLNWIKYKTHAESKNPVIFVPGLYGSMSDEIIQGTGEWGFGMSAAFYEPFIDSLKKMGYTQDQDLFIAFYDWRKDCMFCGQHYLKKKINEVKRITKSKKVDLICHSMGGLVARTYAQSRYYEYDVENLIMIATPNSGATDAYYFWAGGKLPYEKNIKSNIFRTLFEGYLWILEKLYGVENDMEMIHRYLRGARDLLPSCQYGDYLYHIDRNRRKNYIPYYQMEYQNQVLDHLNEKQHLLRRRRIKVTLIAGKENETNHQLQVDPRYKYKDGRWKEGKVVSVSKSLEGDGTVMLKSVFAIEGDSYVFHVNHTEILQKCGFVIRKKLGIEEESLHRSRAGLLVNYTSILVNGAGDIAVKSRTEKGIMTLYDTMEKKEGVFIQEYSGTLKWILLTNLPNELLYIEYIPRDSGQVEIMVTDHLGRNRKVKEKQVAKNQIYRVAIS
ncbi:hypothetical protein QBE52_11780 [Clostridiaceae bacterium 35-E11]